MYSTFFVGCENRSGISLFLPLFENVRMADLFGDFFVGDSLLLDDLAFNEPSSFTQRH